MNVTPIVLLHTNQADTALTIVQQHHGDLTVHTCNDYEQLPAALIQTQAEVVYTVRFAGTPTFPRQALIDAPHVKWISVAGSGTDHLQPWQPESVTVTNAAGVAAHMMAEYTLGCLLSWSLNLAKFRVAQNSRQWIQGQVTPLRGQTALVLGLGHTGCAVAKTLHAIGVNVLGVRANPKPTLYVDEVHGLDSLALLWQRADIIVIAVPLLDSTRDLLSSQAFSQMRKGVVLVDVSRGGVVDEKALVAALNDGSVAAAALDVFATEPLPVEHPFWTMDNVIVTPHCSSVYDGWESNSVEMFSENLNRYRRGETLLNQGDPLRGY